MNRYSSTTFGYVVTGPPTIISTIGMRTLIFKEERKHGNLVRGIPNIINVSHDMWGKFVETEAYLNGDSAFVANHTLTRVLSTSL